MADEEDLEDSGEQEEMLVPVPADENRAGIDRPREAGGDNEWGLAFEAEMPSWSDVSVDSICTARW